LTITDANGCEGIQDFDIQMAQDLELDLGQDQESLPGQAITLDFQTNATIDSVIWESTDPNICENCLEQTVSPEESTTYVLTIVDENGCVISDEINITLTESINIFIPSVFSPNGDGINDSFGIKTNAGVTEVLELTIFDRYGYTVFNAANYDPQDPTNDWDGEFNGRVVETGVYVYYARLALIDGETRLVRGDVTVIQ